MFDRVPNTLLYCQQDVELVQSNLQKQPFADILQNRFLKNFFLVKLQAFRQTFIKKGLQHRCFAVNIAKFNQNSFFYKTPLAAVSGSTVSYTNFLMPRHKASSLVKYLEIQTSILNSLNCSKMLYTINGFGKYFIILQNFSMILLLRHV